MGLELIRYSGDGEFREMWRGCRGIFVMLYRGMLYRGKLLWLGDEKCYRKNRAYERQKYRKHSPAWALFPS